MSTNSSKKRHRSPAYPAMGLQEALRRLQQFYEEQRRASVHIGVASESLGYKPGSSHGARAVAALKSFGLLEDEGTGPSRRVRITDSGYRLVILSETDPAWIEEVRTAAIAPKLYRELADQFGSGGLPSDSALRSHLLLDRNFNPESVPDLITDFRDTYAFAKLDHQNDFDECPGTADDGKPKEAESERGEYSAPKIAASERAAGSQNVATQVAPSERAYSIPLPGNRVATLILPVVVSAVDLRFLEGYLRLMGGAIAGDAAPIEMKVGADEE